MTSLDPSPTPASADEDGRPRSRVPFVIGVLAVLALLGAWVYVLFIYDPGLLIDELADREFPEAAEQVCASAVARLDELPTAASATSATERADVVEQSNVVLNEMVDELVLVTPTSPAELRDPISAWVADWRSYVDDRERYVENLREDPEARFLESPKGPDGKGITRAIDGFAQVNRMESCTTPGDVS